jgi:hypothetical protein
MAKAHGWKYVRSKKNGKNTTPILEDSIVRPLDDNYNAEPKETNKNRVQTQQATNVQSSDNNGNKESAPESDCPRYFEEEAEEEGVYYVRTIIRDEIHVEDDKVITWYLIKEGAEGKYGNTWEPEENVSLEAIAEYRAKCRKRGWRRGV